MVSRPNTNAVPTAVLRLQFRSMMILATTAPVPARTTGLTVVNHCAPFSFTTDWSAQSGAMSRLIPMPYGDHSRATEGCVLLPNATP